MRQPKQTLSNYYYFAGGGTGRENSGRSERTQLLGVFLKSGILLGFIICLTDCEIIEIYIIFCAWFLAQN